MKNLKKIVSVLFSAILLFSATTTSSVAIDKLHFVIGGDGYSAEFVMPDVLVEESIKADSVLCY